MEAETSNQRSEHSRFRAMGTDVHLVAVEAPPGALCAAHDRLLELESRWSRFRPDSELSRLNQAGGQHTFVSAETYELVRLAVDACHLTKGRFDPTVLPALLSAGYDRSFELITDATASGAAGLHGPPQPAAGCAEIELDPVLRTVSLPRGVSLDLGGIAKGHAADLVARELVAAGAAGACVNIGGDAALVGLPPQGETWVVEIDDVLDPDADLGVVQLAGGGVATSTPKVRSWTQHGRPRHHLIDPDTGAPATTDIAAVTVLAASATWAEVLTKAALLAGYPDALHVLADGRAHGILLLDTGDVALTGGLLGVARPLARLP